jgi:uroporphyrinogen-III synthase
MPDPRLLWVTRASPFNARVREAVAAAGHRAMTVPALHVRPLGHLPPAEPTALVLTSARAAVHHAGRSSWLSLPVFVVGDEGAAMARRRGYRDVRRAEGMDDLRDLILGSVSRFGHVVHFGARGETGSPVEELRAAGRSAELCIVCETVRPTSEQLRSVSAALPFVDGIVVHSAPAAEVAAERIAEARWHGVVFCRSAACAAPLATLPGLLVELPPSPTEDALLALLATFRGWPPGFSLRAEVAVPRPAPLRLVVSNDPRRPATFGPGTGSDDTPPAAA